MDNNTATTNHQAVAWTTAITACLIYLLSTCQIDLSGNNTDGDTSLLNQFVANCDTVITIQTQPSNYPSLNGAVRRLGISHVNGKSYEVVSPNKTYEDTGKASWYGPGFHGRKTAVTTIFDENKLSAASRELPLPSVVDVIVRDSRGVCRQMVLPVTDRGPYTKDPDRIIDLSRAAAEKLGFTRQGIADVYTRMDPEKTRMALEQAGVDSSLPETNTTLKLD